MTSSELSTALAAHALLVNPALSKEGSFEDNVRSLAALISGLAISEVGREPDQQSRDQP